MDEISILGEALETAAAARGVNVCVNRPARDGAMHIALGRDRRGRVNMIRQPAPGEGRRTTLNYPDATLSEGRLNPSTSAWIERWAVELTAIRRHVEAVATEGLPAEGFSMRHSMMSEVALTTLKALGHDPVEIMEDLLWEPSQSGYTATIDEHPVFVDSVVLHRYLGSVRLEPGVIRLRGGLLAVNDPASEMECHVEVHGTGEVPETVMAAAVGKKLRDLISLPGGGGTAEILRASTTANGGLMLATKRTVAMIA